MNGDYVVAAVLAALAIVVPLWPTRCHHRWAYGPRTATGWRIVRCEECGDEDLC